MSKRKEILIIGNGRSVLDHSFGKQINKFSIVGRINNYSIDNYAEHVGGKTDIWFNGANQNLKRRKVIHNEIVVFIPPEILRHKRKKFITKFPIDYISIKNIIHLFHWKLWKIMKQ